MNTTHLKTTEDADSVPLLNASRAHRFAEINEVFESSGHFELLFFSKRDEKNNLICRAAVKLGGRSPESKRQRSVA
ncbi:MAG: hypothetical protein IJ599_01305 [Alphaproteobacteria bacterium]|nr:hypothetical protein [Alphaproteobacteria bacterium]